jgi:hypothetical protein
MEAVARQRSSSVMVRRHESTVREASEAAAVLRSLLLSDLPTDRVVGVEEADVGAIDDRRGP